MDKHNVRWGRAILWGAATAGLYALMFSNADILMHMAHTTPDACLVNQGTATRYFHQLDAAACAAQGGRLQAASHWHVLVPILLAFAISTAHGAFTGLFWDLMGLKPATRGEPGK